MCLTQKYSAVSNDSDGNLFFGSISLSFYSRPLTKRRRESNPGRLGGKRERFLCAMPSPLDGYLLFDLEW